MEISINESNITISNYDCEEAQFSSGQHTAIAIVRSVMGFICFTIGIVALVVICKKMHSDKFLHRLPLYLLCAIMLYFASHILQFAIALQPKLQHDAFQNLCTTVGFLVQFSSWLQLLISLWITAHLFYKYYCKSCPCMPFNTYEMMEESSDSHRQVWVNVNHKNPRICCYKCFHLMYNVYKFFAAEPQTILKETMFLTIMPFIALLFSMIPLASSAYGLSGGWCWIEDRDEQCNPNKAGEWEQWFLWYIESIIFQVFLVCFSTVFIVTACISCYKAQNGGSDNFEPLEGELDMPEQRKMDKKAVLLLSIYAVLYLMFSVFELAVRIQQNRSDDYELGLWILLAIVTQITTLFLPVAYLVYLCINRDFCAKYATTIQIRG